MLFDQFFKADRHGFFDNTRVVHVAGHGEQFCAVVVVTAKRFEPAAPAPQDRGHHGNRFHVVHSCRAPIKTCPRRKRWFHPGHALFAFKAFDQGCFFATDVSARAVVQIQIKIPTGFRSVLAQQPSVIGFVNRGLQRLTFTNVFAANIDVAGVCIHRERCDQAAFDQCVRIVAHDFAVFAGAGFGFICIHNQIGRTPIGFLGHKRPFQTGREPRPTAPAQTGIFHFVDDPVAAFFDQLGRAIPMPTRLCALKGAVVHSIDVGKDTIFICKHVVTLCSGDHAKSDMSPPAPRSSRPSPQNRSKTRILSAGPIWAQRYLPRSKTALNPQ